MELFNICTTEIYETFYKYKGDLVMGCPLSPLLEEIFIPNLEENFLKSSFAEHIFFGHRYVDDKIICFTGNDRSTKHLISFECNKRRKLILKRQAIISNI